MAILDVKFKLLEHALGLSLPSYESDGASGLDIRAALIEGEDIIIKPNMRVLVPTGLIVELPNGYEVQIRPRSGLAIKKGITLLNSPGTIDSDYRGEIKIILINHSIEDVIIVRGDRIAQMVVQKVQRIRLVEEALSDTGRSDGGFGSTGMI